MIHRTRRIVGNAADAARRNGRRTVSTALLCAVALLGTMRTAHAIMLAPRTEPGRFTLGATELWYHRDTQWTDGSGESEDRYNLGAFWAKYGFHERLTVFAEFVILNGDPHGQGVSYRHINLGIGANVLLFKLDNFYVSGLANYFENFQHDNQESFCHSTTRHWVALLQVGSVMPLGKHGKLDAWWGPAYVSDGQTFDGGACPEATKESVNNFGGAAGLDFLFWDHLEVFTHVVFARYFQPRLGVGYRF